MISDLMDNDEDEEEIDSMFKGLEEEIKKEEAAKF
jgi:hypothetical protein